MYILGLDITWWASTFCALGMCVVAVSALRHQNHFLVRDPLFLPLYFAGIIQWVLWGVRIEDTGLIYPSLLQILLLAPSLKNWYVRRVQ
jgi:hypothetical protein